MLLNWYSCNLRVQLLSVNPVLQCLVMKKMPPQDLWAWFKKVKAKCQFCFALNHSSKECTLKNKQDRINRSEKAALGLNRTEQD